MEFIESGWSAGAIVRPRLAQLGDILVGISGGQGLEQLAIEYSAKGKPVIPAGPQRRLFLQRWIWWGFPSL